MTFTVAVERKSPDEQFTAEDIKLFHQECGGGEIIRENLVRGEAGVAWKLLCRRCHTTAHAQASENGTALLMKTAIDGESRKIGTYSVDYNNGDDIYAIPRP